MHIRAVLYESNLHILTSVALFCLNIHTNLFFFFKRQVYKSYLNALIEPRPNPGLI